MTAVRASLEAHLGSRQVTRVVYGAIIGLALIVAVESHPPGPAVMIAWLIGTGVAVGLAEIYSEVVGVETSTRHKVTRSQFRHMVDDAVAVWPSDALAVLQPEPLTEPKTWNSHSE